MRGTHLAPHLCYHLGDKKMGSFFKEETPYEEQSHVNEGKPKIRTEYRGFVSSTGIENY